MTKFEEEFKALTSWDWVNVDLIQQILTRFGNWHSDEEFQDMKAIGGSFALASQNLIDENKKLVKEISDLKSQLEQQALPVVPECVAEWIEILKTKGLKPLKNPETYGETGFTEEKLQNIVFWISERQEDYMRAWLDGYTVEKPQLFYLREKNTGYYLRKKGNNEYGITPHYSNDYDEKYMHYKFTQQEIDSMQTGSYELVPVEDGE